MLKKVFTIIFILLMFSVFYPVSARAKADAKGYLRVSFVSYKARTSELVLSVNASSPTTTPFNAVGLNLDFSSSSLELLNSNKGDFCDLTIQDEIKESGYSLKCGAYGYNAPSNANITRLVFRVNDPGWTKVSLSGSRLLANDGHGTEIPLNMNNLHLNLP
jgi:hypothetical protein